MKKASVYREHHVSDAIKKLTANRKEKKPLTNSVCRLVVNLIRHLFNETVSLKQAVSELESKNAILQADIKERDDKITLMKGGRDSRTSSTSPSQDLGRSNQNSLRAAGKNKQFLEKSLSLPLGIALSRW